MMTLTDFLLARIAEDEEAARAAISPDRPGAHWQWVNTDDDSPAEFGGEYRAVSLRTVEDFPVSYADWRLPAFIIDHAEADSDEFSPLPHIARHDPARVLAECEAKRRIVEWHQNWPVLVETEPEYDHPVGDLDTMTFRMSKRMAWLTEQEYRTRFGSEPPTGPILRLLALSYADHPDYRDEWKP